MSRRLTPDAYHALAAERGLTWLGDVVTNNRTKTRWLCPKGHIWEARYSDVQRYGCAQCANERTGERCRHKPEKYHELAQARGFDWIGDYPKESHTKTRWRCSQGHEWNAAYGDIRDGHGCPHCAGLAPKTPEDYHSVAQMRGFKWVGGEVVSVITKTRWRCANGHEWYAAYHDVRKGNGCPHCSQQSPLTAGDYAHTAYVRGFFWVGTLPQSAHHRTRWQCQKGHVWEQTLQNIMWNKSGCPYCRDFVNGQPVSQVQRRLHEMIGGELNYPVGRYRVDVAFPDTMIAVEYDCWYWHTMYAERDQKRDDMLIKFGWHVLRIKSGVKLPLQSQFDEAVARLVSGDTYTEIVLDDWVY